MIISITVLTAIKKHISSAPQPHWGDVPTWILAAIAFLALVAAVAAYLKQAKAARDLATQVSLQRDALDDQRAANARQGAALEAQLKDLARRASAIEREQADEVDLRAGLWRGRVPGVRTGDGSPVHTAEVVNLSRRPIRSVVCQLQLPVGDVLPACLVGRFEETTSPVGPLAGQAQRILMDDVEDSKIRLARAGETVLFVFRADYATYPGAHLTLRFTDDAGVHWQIDNDLHLEPLPGRDW